MSMTDLLGSVNSGAPVRFHLPDFKPIRNPSSLVARHFLLICTRLAAGINCTLRKSSLSFLIFAVIMDCLPPGTLKSVFISYPRERRSSSSQVMRSMSFVFVFLKLKKKGKKKYILSFAVCGGAG